MVAAKKKTTRKPATKKKNTKKAEAGRKGGKATQLKYAEIKKIAKRWPIGKSWSEQIEFCSGMVGKSLEENKEAQAMYWTKYLQKAMEAKDRKEGDGERVTVIIQKEALPTTDRPDPPKLLNGNGS